MFLSVFDSFLSYKRIYLCNDSDFWLRVYVSVLGSELSMEEISLTFEITFMGDIVFEV